MRCESSWRIPPSLSISRIKRKGDKGELKNLRNVVAEAKAREVKVVSAVVKRMLDKNMFLFGFVDVNESSAAERLDELTGVQNASIQIACKKLFADTRIEHFTHMDMVCLFPRICFQLCTFAYGVIWIDVASYQDSLKSSTI
ncbi:hypothetical protein BC332_22274 [Capsicum chinense]|nr:hypothetical protein BC332_22274 [Capsicum chinense]